MPRDNDDDVVGNATSSSTQGYEAYACHPVNYSNDHLQLKKVEFIIGVNSVEKYTFVMGLSIGRRRLRA